MPLIMEMSLQSGLFILLLLILRPFLKKWLPAISRYALWGIPALRLMIPLSFKSVLGLWQHVPVPQMTMSRAAVQTALLPPAAQAMPAAESSQAMATAPAAPQAFFLPAQTILALIWLIGSLVMLIIFLRMNLRFYRGVKGAVPVGGIDAPIPVMLVTKDISPCLAGLARPRILLPGHVLALPELADMVILHEVTHYRHKDHLITALRSLLLILWWWNPLVWLMARLGQEDCEAACDEGVIRRMTLEERKDYGKSLVALLRAQHARPTLLAAGTAMGGSKKIIKERITMIANWKQKGRLATLATALAIVLAIPFLFSSAQTAPVSGPLPMDYDAVTARLYADFTGDEQIRIHRALAPLFGQDASPIQPAWEAASAKVSEALRPKAEELLNTQSDPTRWQEADKAAMFDALAAAFEAAGYPLPAQGLAAPEKARRFSDLLSQLYRAPEDMTSPDDQAEETWKDQWYATFTSPDFRSVQGKVDFKKEWMPKVEELLEAGTHLPENGDLRHMLSLDFQLPAEGSISEAEALDKARAAILDKKGWKADELDNFRLWSSAYLVEKDGSPVFWFAFSWDEDKLIKAGTLEMLEAQRLEQAFPMVVAVKVSAQTGDLYAFAESFDLMTPYNRTI